MRVCMYTCMRVCVHAYSMRVCMYSRTYSGMRRRYVFMCTRTRRSAWLCVCLDALFVCVPRRCRVCSMTACTTLHNCTTTSVRACMHVSYAMLCYAMLCMRVRGRQACAHSHIRLAAHALRLRAAARRTAETPNLLRTHARKQQSVRSMLTRRR